MNKSILVSTVFCLIASTAVAQTTSYFIPDNVATSGGCNVIPFGTQRTSTTWADQRYQTMATAADLGNAAVLNICDLAFARCGAGNTVTSFDSIEIVLGQTTATTLSTTFATNLVTNVQTVLSAKNYEWHTTGGQWSRIGLDRDYLYIAAQGATLVVQVTVTGTNQAATTGFHTGARPRMYNYRWGSSTPPTTGTLGSTAALKWEVVVQGNDLSTFGSGCRGSNGVPALGFTGSAKLGSSFSIDVSNCVANALSFHVIGLRRFASPIDLGIAGAPGCSLYQSTDIILPQIANGTGDYSFKTPVPNDRALICFRLYTQAFPSDPQANNFGRSASNYGRILPGN